MFAIHISYPSMVFLTPLLKHRQPFQTFLAQRVVESRLLDLSHPSVDHFTVYWHQRMDTMIQGFFGDKHGLIIQQMRWQVGSVNQWLPNWMSYIHTLCWDEWCGLDIDIQRLFVLLDYECPVLSPSLSVCRIDR